jgi:hypothetical protein
MSWSLCALLAAPSFVRRPSARGLTPRGTTALLLVMFTVASMLAASEPAAATPTSRTVQVTVYDGTGATQLHQYTATATTEDLYRFSVAAAGWNDSGSGQGQVSIDDVVVDRFDGSQTTMDFTTTPTIIESSTGGSADALQYDGTGHRLLAVSDSGYSCTTNYESLDIGGSGPSSVRRVRFKVARLSGDTGDGSFWEIFVGLAPSDNQPIVNATCTLNLPTGTVDDHLGVRISGDGDGVRREIRGWADGVQSSSPYVMTIGTSYLVDVQVPPTGGQVPPTGGQVPPTGSDPSGVDFDASCVIADPQVPVGAGNNIPSTNPPGAPGGSLGVPAGGSGCQGISTYDGGTESTDFRSVALSRAGSQIVAEFTVDGPIPPAGSTCNPAFLIGSGCPDLPDNKFGGFGYKAMFQNPSLQNNAPYATGSTQCCFGTPIFGLNEHWRDGFHFFVGFDATWNGHSWIHSAQIGTYDPSPDGGFFFDELGTSTALNIWDDDDPCFPRSGGANWDVIYGPGNKVTVKVDGVVKFANLQALGGCLEAWYAKPGDDITNIKGLSTADTTVTLPFTMPLSLVPGFSDITSVGGFSLFSDVTTGNSINMGLGAVLAVLTGDSMGTPCANEGLGIRPCVSYTPGLAHAPPTAGRRLEADQEEELPRAFASVPDTLGGGPRCWTYTYGGILPPNPLWVANQACHIDDDNIVSLTGNIDPGERGTVLAEFWDTNYSIIF